MNVVMEYLTRISKSSNTEPPNKDLMKEMKNITTIEAKIHESGWVLNSDKETTVTSENYTAIERCLIDMK